MTTPLADAIARVKSAPPYYQNDDLCLITWKERDVLLSAAESFERERARADKAVKSLEQAGFTDGGGEFWRPPLGPDPYNSFNGWIYWKDRCANIERQASDVARENEAQAARIRELEAATNERARTQEYMHENAMYRRWLGEAQETVGEQAERIAALESELAAHKANGLAADNMPFINWREAAAHKDKQLEQVHAENRELTHALAGIKEVIERIFTERQSLGGSHKHFASYYALPQNLWDALRTITGNIPAAAKKVLDELERLRAKVSDWERVAVVIAACHHADADNCIEFWYKRTEELDAARREVERLRILAIKAHKSLLDVGDYAKELWEKAAEPQKESDDVQ